MPLCLRGESTQSTCHSLLTVFRWEGTCPRKIKVLISFLGVKDVNHSTERCEDFTHKHTWSFPSITEWKHLRRSIYLRVWRDPIQSAKWKENVFLFFSFFWRVVASCLLSPAITVGLVSDKIEKRQTLPYCVYKYKQYIQSPTLFYIQCCRFEHADATTPAI
jgi:hypothetical protein